MENTEYQKDNFFRKYYFLEGKGRIEVLAVIKNYVLWRFKGYFPQVHTKKDFKEFVQHRKPSSIKINSPKQ